MSINMQGPSQISSNQISASAVTPRKQGALMEIQERLASVAAGLEDVLGQLGCQYENIVGVSPFDNQPERSDKESIPGNLGQIVGQCNRLNRILSSYRQIAQKFGEF